MVAVVVFELDGGPELHIGADLLQLKIIVSRAFVSISVSRVWTSSTVGSDSNGWRVVSGTDFPILRTCRYNKRLTPRNHPPPRPAPYPTASHAKCYHVSMSPVRSRHVASTIKESRQALRTGISTSRVRELSIMSGLTRHHQGTYSLYAKGSDLAMHD